MYCGATCRVKVKSSGKLIVKCPLNTFDADIETNAFCRAKVMYYLGRITSKKLVIECASVNKLYEGESLELLSSYAKGLFKIRTLILSGNLLLECYGILSCREAKLSFLQSLFTLQPPLGLLYRNPFEALLRIKDEIKGLKLASGPHSTCGECLENYLSILNEILKTLKASKLVKKGLKQKQPFSLLKASKVTASSYSVEAPPPYLRVLGKVLEEYVVHPFNIKIMKSNSLQHLYLASLSLTPWERLMLIELVKRLKKASTYIEGVERNRLSLLINMRRRDVKTVFEKLWFEGFRTTENIDRILEASVYKSLGLLKIAPFLLDENVEEFFLDRPSSKVYLIHTKYGRCLSNTSLNEDDVNRIITHLKLESGLLLDYENPSLKCELLTDRFHVRASVDIPPLTVDGPTLDFRKLRKKVWTLPELVGNGTLTAEAAAYILFSFFRRRNITVVGEPATGKTTLINAIDLCSPPHWKKVYIEDVVESLSQFQLGNHQVRFRVSPFEARKAVFTKSFEVIKLLHRSPDVVILSEIQTPEHSKALFHSLSSGLRGLQTCHASTIEGLLRKWVLHHGISVVNLLDLDLLIQMKTLLIEGKEVRKMVRLREIECGKASGRDDLDSIRSVDVFNWTLDAGLIKCMDLYETPTLLKIKKYEDLSRKMFKEEIDTYKNFLEKLSQEPLAPELTSTLFNQLFLKYVAKERG